MNTIFTQIIYKEIPGYIIYEDDLVVAFLDIAQTTKGHTLVVTKEEYVNIHEVPSDIFAHLFRVVQKISLILVKTFNAKGINLFNNNGEVAGQQVPHYHVHLLPRYNEKEITIKSIDRIKKLTKNDYEEIKNNILKKFQKEGE
jgi:histidine triad (HIT) family protein